MKFLITAVFIFTILFGGFLTQDVFAQRESSDAQVTRESSNANTHRESSDASTFGSVSLESPLDSNISSIPKFFQAIIDILLVFAIPFIVFFIIYAGFLYVTARGNVETISKAHKALLYALIGGVLILGANVLLDVITGTVTDITG